jgi:negative regulator of flagellin synthesis FlgM
MKIVNLPETVVSNTPAAAAKPAERPAAPLTASAQAEASASVSVQLSPVTQTMTKGVARSGTDVFNAEKVQAMRTAIENGSFSANAEAIADKLLSNAREMLGVASAGNRRVAG